MNRDHIGNHLMQIYWSLKSIPELSGLPLVSVRRLLESFESVGFDGAHLDSREGPPLWTDKNRAKYDRDHLRYPSDLTDDEWAYVEPLIPPARRGGGKRRTDMRAVINGVMYILSHWLPMAVHPKRLSAAQHVA